MRIPKKVRLDIPVHPPHRSLGGGARTSNEEIITINEKCNS